MADGDAHSAAIAAAAAKTLPPHDLDAERAVLGGVLLDETALGRITHIVVPANFYHPAHAVIFEAMTALASRGEPIDVVTVAHDLGARERLNTIGGAQYLGQLTDAIATTAHIEQHASIVADIARVRRVIATAHEITARGYGERGVDREFIDRAGRDMLAACEQPSRDEPKPYGECLAESFERLERAHGSDEVRVTGIATGFDDFDAMTHGLHAGDLVILAARPSMGKSALVQMLAVRAARDGYATLVESFEMKRRQYGDRGLACDAGVDHDRIRSMRLTQDDMTAMTGSAQRNYRLPLWINYRARGNVRDVAGTARRWKQRHGLSLLVVDHFHAMQHERERGEREDVVLARTTREFKAIAGELDIPVVILMQLNRAPERREDHRPVIADLREVGAAEQDADLISFLYRDEVYNPQSPDRGIAEWIVRKQRDGVQSFTVRLRWRPELQRFENLAADDPQHDPRPEVGDGE